MLKKILISLALLVAAIALSVAWSYQGVVTRVPVQEKLVALTFDDGPNPPYTGELLSLLRERNVRATFFPKARNVEAFPDAARDIVEAGHEIGNHSYDHYAMNSWSADRMLSEIERANDSLRRVMGVETRLFRPPFGVQSLGVRRALEKLEMRSILASAHGTDWEERDAASIAASILEDTGPGAIILLHDGHGDVDDPRAQDSRAASVEATRMLIDTLEEQGYRFVTVGELLSLWPE